MGLWSTLRNTASLSSRAALAAAAFSSRAFDMKIDKKGEFECLRSEYRIQG